MVIQTETLDAAAQAWLRERADLRVCPHDSEAFFDILPRASGLVVRTYTRVDRSLLERAPNLKVVGRAGVALENIDIAACRARGVEVVHTPAANTQAVVEFVLCLLLDALRPRVFLDGPLEGQAWHEARNELQGDCHLSDLDVGILGFGRIGSRVGKALAALGSTVRFHDIKHVPEAQRHGCESVSLEELQKASQVLTIHVDWNAGNHHLVNAGFLGTLRDDCIIVNTSRGLAIDPEALADWLRANPKARALLDVHDPHEPLDAGYPLLGLPNAHLAPHIAAATAPARLNMSWVVRDVVAVLEGRPPQHPAPK
ncbi:MAG: NAD(P)-dependent oxidoreductase [Phycisphaerales bacterium JB058]